MTSPSRPAEGGRAAVVGTGLIGGSVGMALRARGWHVTGRDRDAERAKLALHLGALDEIGTDPDPEITIIATPVSDVAAAAREAVLSGGIVTDVGSVKAPIVSAVDHPMFVGGHPMAGSEQEGVESADPSLFEGATWVLTPTPHTDPRAYARLRSVVSSLGADVVAVAPDRHDTLVAIVSHVPHLTAAALMALADEVAEEHAALLRLAAGGFRDMTRIAAGNPEIWLDICAENREAIVAALDRLMDAVAELRTAVGEGNRELLLATLDRARHARRNLPVRAVQPERLVEVRVPVPDRPGVIAEVSTLLGELGVNIFDLELAHSAEGRGVIVMLIDAAASDLIRGALLARRYRPSFHPLG